MFSLSARLSGRHFVVKDKYDLVASLMIPEKFPAKSTFGGGLNEQAYKILGVNREENPFFLEYCINPKSLLQPFQVHYYYYRPLPNNVIAAMANYDTTKQFYPAGSVLPEPLWRQVAKEDIRSFFLRSSALKFIAQSLREFDEFTSRNSPARLAIEAIKLE